MLRYIYLFGCCLVTPVHVTRLYPPHLNAHHKPGIRSTSVSITVFLSLMFVIGRVRLVDACDFVDLYCLKFRNFRSLFKIEQNTRRIYITVIRLKELCYTNFQICQEARVRIILGFLTPS